MHTGFPYQTGDDPQKVVVQAARLIHHLERISADSPYAHRSSGVRGTLLKELAKIEDQDRQMHGEDAAAGQERLQQMVEMGSGILLLAAKEIPPS